MHFSLTQKSSIHAKLKPLLLLDNSVHLELSLFKKTPQLIHKLHEDVPCPSMDTASYGPESRNGKETTCTEFHYNQT